MAFYKSANGKLLITGEYFVLDGAKALAMPTKYGQQIQFEEVSEDLESKDLHSKGIFTNPIFSWRSNDAFGEAWFDAKFQPKTFDILQSSDETTAKTLQNILINAAEQSENKNLKTNAYKVETWLTYPREWGLGSSSTLIYLIAKIFEVNPYLLLEKTFGGSGYDIACAYALSPIIYKLKNKNTRDVNAVEWQPPFSSSLYFLYLNKKQNSREGITLYRANRENKNDAIEEISEITEAVLTIKTLHDFERLLTDHERIVQSFVHLPRAKFLYFSDYWGEIKSLGAWGGDFVLVTSERNEDATRLYFSNKGFDTLIPFNEIKLEL